MTLSPRVINIIVRILLHFVKLTFTIFFIPFVFFFKKNIHHKTVDVIFFIFFFILLFLAGYLIYNNNNYLILLLFFFYYYSFPPFIYWGFAYFIIFLWFLVWKTSVFSVIFARHHLCLDSKKKKTKGKQIKKDKVFWITFDLKKLTLFEKKRRKINCEKQQRVWKA